MAEQSGMIQLIQDAVWCRVQSTGVLPPRVHTLLRHGLGYRTEETYVPSLGKTVGGQWVSCYDGVNRRFPRGLARQACAMLMQQGYAVVGYNVTRAMPKPEADLGTYHPPHALRWYQEEAVAQALASRYCQLQLPTGTGKTAVGIEIVHRVQPHATVWVTSGKTLLAQTADELRAAFPEVQIQQWGGSNKANGKGKEVDLSKPYIIVSTFQSFHNNDNMAVLENVDAVIIDECHFAAAETFSTAAKVCPNPWLRIGLTATPFRETSDQLLLEAYMGEVKYAVASDVVVREGFLCPAHVGQINLDKITQDDLQALLAGRKTLIITEHVKSTQYLKDRFPWIDVLTGETKVKELKERFEQFKQAASDALIATSIFDTGVNVPSIDQIIHYGCFNSLNKLIQRNGRALRIAPNKTHATILHNTSTKNDRVAYHRMRDAVYTKEVLLYPRIT
jgi:superfamily II DNA or RNA helicase